MNDQQLPGRRRVARGRARLADVDLPSDEEADTEPLVRGRRIKGHDEHSSRELARLRSNPQEGRDHAE